MKEFYFRISNGIKIVFYLNQFGLGFDFWVTHFEKTKWNNLKRSIGFRITLGPIMILGTFYKEYD